MRTICLILVAGFWTSDLVAQSSNPPLDDTRLTIHTLVREDVFAGWQSDNMDRLARAEKNIELLLEQRPAAKAELLAWKGGATLYRAILAHEAGEEDKFKAYYQQVTDLFAEARKLDRQSVGVCAVCGGSQVMFGDRLPEELRHDAFSEAWDDYRIIWAQQGRAIDQLPEHIGGELLAGLAMAAQRTGRAKESEKYLDKILEVLPDTGYAREAQKWKDDPQQAAVGQLACKSCHSEGRLKARISELGSK